MPTRNEILQRLIQSLTLSGLGAQQLNALLADQNLVKNAVRLAAASGLNGQFAANNMGIFGESSVNRAKRPLNAFMAFRTYYMKLFPQIQQKTVSGFLTTLWNKDPDSVKWALIARVYSFVRDHLGQGKITLGAFLDVACPTMGIISAGEYLHTLSWLIDDTNDTWSLTQHEQIAAHRLSNYKKALHENIPTTEIDLVTVLVNAGYLPEEGLALLERLKACHSGIMTTGEEVVTQTQPANISVPRTVSKSNFVDTVLRDPYQAAQLILGPQNDPQCLMGAGIHSWEVHTMNDISWVPISIPQPYDPNVGYNFTTEPLPQPETEINMNEITENEIIDIDCAFAVDRHLGYFFDEGDRFDDFDDF